MQGTVAYQVTDKDLAIEQDAFKAGEGVRVLLDLKNTRNAYVYCTIDYL